MRKNARGFTIVELLIVIVVIAILAAISVVAYTGIQQRAAEAALVSDLTNAEKQLKNDHVLTGSFPPSLAAANDGNGIAASSTTTYAYTSNGTEFCLTATSDQAKRSYYTSDKGTMIDGSCPGHSGYAYGGGVPEPTSWTVSTFVGDGVSGGQDGTGTEVQLRNPYGIVVASDGTLYTTETGGRIRRISPAGVTVTIAGATASGFVNANGSAARFSSPTGIVIGQDGALLVSDRNNHAIRRVAMNGDVTTYAGTGAQGFTNGDRSVATFRLSVGNDLAIDSQGNLFVADAGNGAVRKIDASGQVSTYIGADAGHGNQYVEGLAVGPNDELYVGNFSIVQKIRPGDSTLSTFAGGVYGFQDGNGINAQLRRASDIAADARGNLYVADYHNHAIRKIDPAGTVKTIAGTGVSGYVDGPGSSAQFNAPYGIGVSADGSVVYVADWGNQRIRKLVPNY